MKITMYDLLGLVKDNKTPKKIKYDDRIYTFNDKKDNYYENETCSINWDYVSFHCLNEEVEILEEEILEQEKKIPEKLTIERLANSNQSIQDDIIETINQLIDYLKSKGDE